VRKLLIHGARSCLLHLDRDQHALGRWLNRLVQRVHRNKAVVALANKIALMAWAVTDKARRALPQEQRRRGGLSRSASPERLAGRNLMTKWLSGDA
jgi:hypothetical protein